MHIMSASQTIEARQVIGAVLDILATQVIEVLQVIVTYRS